MTEVWKDAPGYEGRYQVSSEGRIRSLERIEGHGRYARTVKGRVLKLCLSTDGYPHVSLRIDGKLRLVSVHRLIALAFVPGRNELHKEVAHLDGKRTNIAARNLKWVSRGENHSHRFIHGTVLRGERHPKAKLTERDIGNIRATHEPARVLAERYGISVYTVSDIRRRRRWKHVA